MYVKNNVRETNGKERRKRPNEDKNERNVGQKRDGH